MARLLLVAVLHRAQPSDVKAPSKRDSTEKDAVNSEDVSFPFDKDLGAKGAMSKQSRDFVRLTHLGEVRWRLIGMI